MFFQIYIKKYYLLKEQILRVVSKLAERQTNENSFRHLSSQSDRLAAVIYNKLIVLFIISKKIINKMYLITSLISETGSLSFFRGCRSKTYRLLGHSRSGRLAIKYEINFIDIIEFCIRLT